GLVQFFMAAGEDIDERSFSNEPLGRCQSNPAGGAGNHGDLVLQSRHRWFLNRWNQPRRHRSLVQGLRPFIGEAVTAPTEKGLFLFGIIESDTSTQSPSRLPNNVDGGSNAGFEALEPDNVDGRGWIRQSEFPRFAKYDGIQKRQGLLTVKACPACSPQDP